MASAAVGHCAGRSPASWGSLQLRRCWAHCAWRLRRSVRRAAACRRTRRRWPGRLAGRGAGRPQQLHPSAAARSRTPRTAACSATANACCRAQTAATTASTPSARRARRPGRAAHRLRRRPADAARSLLLHRRPLRELQAHRAVSRSDRRSCFCVDLRRNATMQLQTVRPNIVQAIRAYRVEDLMQAAAGGGPAFPVREPGRRAVQAGSAGRHRRVVPVPGAFRQEPGRPVRLHDRPGAQGRRSSRASWSCWSSCPTTRASTARRASSCSTCSAMRPTSGRSEKYHSDASILFSSPLPGKRVMGAGDGSGPSSEAGSRRRRRAKTGSQPELRHEHAADEQRVRHGDVAQRRLARS